MSSTPRTTTANTDDIDMIVKAKNEWKGLYESLEETPHHPTHISEEARRRKRSEEDLLVPALKTAAKDAKDANTKLKEWISVVGVVDELWNASALRYQVGGAREKLVDAVWDLEATVYELRKTLRFDGGTVLNKVIDPSAEDSSEEEE
ncbi:uncharacterized protein J4E88_009623 [Alternaria novae-zelandiae]|uniref:uncharacterized protein n=1 Tax=Alternaria novae-zelandiae TaxID=430562 RepID=UPI0020C2149D|nr:uncharacterized protein J4E88_009623 [Alternaria novae-zelandiae]KAI4670871.1 hypothetical protein J4E88_009623 [Alternaria novae-zelandiae]